MPITGMQRNALRAGDSEFFVAGNQCPALGAL